MTKKTENTKKVTREKFIMAVNMADEVAKKLHPRTRLAHYCEQFLEDNDKLSKEHVRKQNEITRKLNKEINDCKVDNAVEKDNVLLRESDKPNSPYKYDKAGALAVLKKTDEVTAKMEKVIDDFMMEEIEVVCRAKPMELPDKIAYETEKALRGFVFQNPNEFEKEEEKHGN